MKSSFKISARGLVESWWLVPSIRPRIRFRCLDVGSRGKQVVVGDRFNFLARLLLSTKGMKGKKRLVRLLRLGNGMDRRWNDGNGTRMEANGPLDRPLIG